MTPEKPYQAEICNLCGSEKFRQVHYFSEWTMGRVPVKDVAIIQCNGCGVRRRFPGIEDNYEDEYHANYVTQGSAIHPHQLSIFADLLHVRIRSFGEKDLSFLDVGCSTGRALALAKLLGFKPTGLDYSNWAVEYCRKLGFQAEQGSLIGHWEEGERFDVVHFSHTIEHVPDPIAYLREIHRQLKVGGHLMLACPNYASLPRMLLRARWPVWILDSHLWQFTKRQMERILERVGFEIRRSSTLHGYSPDSSLKRRLLDAGAVIGLGTASTSLPKRPKQLIASLRVNQ